MATPTPKGLSESVCRPAGTLVVAGRGNRRKRAAWRGVRAPVALTPNPRLLIESGLQLSIASQAACWVLHSGDRRANHGGRRLVTPNPVLDFGIDKDSIRYIGRDLQR